MPLVAPGPDTPDFVDLRELALEIGREGSALAVQMRDVGIDVSTKSTATDMVTAADRAVEDLIRRRIAEARPDDRVLGEEAGLGEGVDTPGSVRWVVDPIDGTTNYVYGFPGWACSIAAELDGVVVAGAVVDPSHRDELAAAVGHGATRNGVPLQLADPPPVSSVLLATGFGYAAERRAQQAQLLLQVIPQIRDIRRMGAASVDLCSVAIGRVDAYYEWGLMPWDWAAGALIAAEAGARVANLEGGPLQVDGRVLATHPALWDQLAQLLIAAEPEAPDLTAPSV